jgi:uncharacterized protein (TIGR01777 family)|tara:strand:- start:2492 stop:3562 length:1071 start_codon:yes stop_codon:yes gene_type:complete
MMRTSSIENVESTSPPTRRRRRRRRERTSAIKATAQKNERDAPMTIAISGGTGFVGKRLTEKLLEEGSRVKILTSKSNTLLARLSLGPKSALSPNVSVHKWETITGKLEWTDAIKGCDGVVNLAGAPVATRWNKKYKETLVNSRVGCTNRIVDAINKLPEKERPSLVSSSAVGYYGTTKKDEEWTETQGSGGDFLASLCEKWEKAANKAKTNVTIVRTGVVLEKGGGALGKILPLFYLYSGGPVGSGTQWVSWIHREDLVDIMMMALKNPKKFKGVVNGVAPEPTTMNGLCEAIAKATNRPNWLPAPGLAVRVLLGEGATVVLDGQKVVPEKTREKGYEFKYANINEALDAIVNGP